MRMATAALFLPLTNRATSTKEGKFQLPSDGFVMLVPRGEAPNVLDDGTPKGKRIIQVVDDTALDQIMHKLLNRGGEMLIDSEHFSHDLTKATDANGWLPLDASTLQKRADGLYGDPRWSTEGLQKVEGGVLRYVSPEFASSAIEPLGGNRYRVTDMTGLALTNRPGFRRLQRPLTNRDADDGIDTATTNTMHKALLAAHLGITETELDKLDEGTLRNRLSGIKDKATEADGLKTELDTIKNREADEFIAKHDKAIPKSEKVRKHLRGTFLANRDLAEELVVGYSEEDGKNLTDEQRKRAETKPLFNRGSAAQPQDDAVLRNREQQRASQIRNRATAICEERRNARRPVDFHTAFKMAEAEFPAAS